MCAACVAASVRPAGAVKRSRSILWTVFAAGGIALAWLIFYYLGAMLARIPSDFSNWNQPSIVSEVGRSEGASGTVT